jgi:hypothetical protein
MPRDPNAAGHFTAGRHAQYEDFGRDGEGWGYERVRAANFTSGSKLRTAAIGETTGYAPAFRHVFDWRPRGRSG